jgi:hypothetical protein
MKIKFKLNQSLRGLPEGHVISLEVDKAGMPIDKYWRRRMIDAKHDNCMTKFAEESKTVFKTEKKIDGKKKIKDTK